MLVSSAITAPPESSRGGRQPPRDLLSKRRIGFLWGYYQPGQRCLFRQATHSGKFLPVIFTHEHPEVFAGENVLLIQQAKGKKREQPAGFFQRYFFRGLDRPPPASTSNLTLSEAIVTHGIELLHVFQGNKAIQALASLKLLSVPVTVSFHGNDLAKCIHQPEYRRQLPELFGLAACLMVRSEHMGQQLIAMGAPAGKIWLNRTGIPVDHFPYRRRERQAGQPLHLIQVCRLVPKKGLGDTLAALAQVRSKLKGPVLLWIAGEGELRDGLEQKIRELNLSESVQLLGFLQEEKLVEALHWAHLYLQPSVTTETGDQEGIPNAMLEAMLTGLAPITTRHAGIPEAVTDGQTGWLIEEHGVDQLAERILWCAEHPVELEMMGQAARQRVIEQFSLEKRMALLDDKYAEIIQMFPTPDRTRGPSLRTSAREIKEAKPQPDPLLRVGYLWGRPKAEERCIFRQITSPSGFHPIVFARPPVDIFAKEPVTLITFESRKATKDRQSEDDGAAGELQGMRPLDYALFRAIKEANVQLLHVFYGDKAINYLPALQPLAIPVTVSFHGRDVPDCLHQPELRQRLPDLFDFVALVMVRSDYMGQKLRALGCPPEKLYINRTGIPMDRFPFTLRGRSSADRVIYLQACRLIAKKGLFDTLTAFENVLQVLPQAQLWIAGKGDLQPALQEQIEKRRLGAQVKMLGYLEEAPLAEAFRQAHIFLHPSVTTVEEDQEGIPNAMLEAMASGLVPITTRHAGIPEIIINGKNGWLVDESDAAHLAERMIWSARHPQEMEAMSYAARESVAVEYDLETRAQELQKLFARVIEDHTPSSRLAHV